MLFKGGTEELGERECGCHGSAVKGFRCCQACCIASCIAKPSSNILNSHTYIIRLSAKKTRCKCSLKGDRLSKQNTLPTLGRVCCAMVDSSTRPKISTLTFRGAQTTRQNVHCAKKVKLEAKADFTVRLRSTSSVRKHSRLHEFGGDGCVRALLVCQSPANTLIWMQ